MKKSSWKLANVCLAGALLAGSVGGLATSAQAAGAQHLASANSGRAVSAQWRNWVNGLANWLRNWYAIRAVNFGGSGQFCTITMSQGRTNYVCEVNNFSYTIRATR